MDVSTITPDGLETLRRRGDPVELIDVRTTLEYRQVHAESARSVPLDRLDPRAVMEARNGAKRKTLYVICRSGSRGRQACEAFQAAGFPDVVNVEGGTLAWIRPGCRSCVARRWSPWSGRCGRKAKGSGITAPNVLPRGKISRHP